jgi:hypothetical protein
MAKVSRPIIYTALAAAVTFVVVVVNQPDAPAPKHITRLGKTTHVILAGYTEADQTAHFARYTGRMRDAFVPGVATRGGSGSLFGDGSASNGRAGAWTLTGINEIDGSLSALVENSTTSDSMFLKKGDRWNGLRVLSVESGAVVFLNALGQQTRLAFAETEPDTTSGPVAGDRAAAVPSAPPIPGAAASGQSIGVLPPLPVMPPATARFNRQGS